MPSLYDRNMKLEETLAQFMQVSMSNQNSNESAIKNLEVHVGQLAKQLAERSSKSFTVNTEKNPKEECKAVMTRRKMEIQVEGGRADQKVFRAWKAVSFEWCWCWMLLSYSAMDGS